MELDSESLNSLHIKIQEFLFKKSEYDEVNSYLVSKVIEDFKLFLIYIKKFILEFILRHITCKFIFIWRI